MGAIPWNPPAGALLTPKAVKDPVKLRELWRKHYTGKENRMHGTLAFVQGMTRAVRAVRRLMVKEAAGRPRFTGRKGTCPSWREPLPSEEK